MSVNQILDDKYEGQGTDLDRDLTLRVSDLFDRSFDASAIGTEIYPGGRVVEYEGFGVGCSCTVGVVFSSP
jgi:hypothetical protein